MSEPPVAAKASAEPGVLGSLPATRPHRRSARRERPTGRRPPRAAAPRPARSAPSPRREDPLETALTAAGEVAKTGLTLGVKALRMAVARLPRP